MSVLADINKALAPLKIPLETGVFGDNAPDKYIVIIPLADAFAVKADNAPTYDVQEARISLFCKGNYGADKNRIVRALLSADLTITSRQYIGYETDTGYHHYVVDVENHYKMEDL